MIKSITVILIFISSLTYCSIDVEIVYQRNCNEAELSAYRWQDKLEEIYPHANTDMPGSVSDIKFESDTLIFLGIFHSNPVPGYAQSQFGKLMMFLDNVPNGNYNDYKEKVFLSADLHKKLQNHRGKKLIIIDGCYAELAFKKIENTSWLFACNSSQVNLIRSGTGFFFSDIIIKKIKQHVNLSDLANYINTVYQRSNLYKSKVSKKYNFVKNRPSVNNKYKCIVNGQFIF